MVNPLVVGDFWVSLTRQDTKADGVPVGPKESDRSAAQWPQLQICPPDVTCKVPF
jgi:hypothetical protein